MASGYTISTEQTAVFKWKIRNIRSHLSDWSEPFMISSAFSSGSKKNDRWCINLFFNNQTQFTRSSKYLSVFLNNLTNCNVEARVKFYVINNQQENILIFKSPLTEFNSNLPRLGVKYFLAKSIKNMYEFLFEDSLTIAIEVTVNDDEATVPVTSSFDCSTNSMKNDYKELYKSRAYSDITIIVDNQEVQAHRIILMARSPVLAAMFNHDMIEKKTNQVKIKDISPEIFEKLLEYIYTDEVSDLEENATELLEAADKYQLASLMKMCEESLCKSLTRENVLKVLVLADRHNAKDLKEYVTKCISVDASEIVKTEDFKEYEQSNPSLGLGLFKVLAANNQRTRVTYYTFES